MSPVASIQQLIKGTNCTSALNCTSPCTLPHTFLLVFLETNLCTTLYPTLCFWKQLRGRGIVRSPAHSKNQRKGPGIHCCAALNFLCAVILVHVYCSTYIHTLLTVANCM